jgi:hypothetical protein
MAELKQTSVGCHMVIAMEDIRNRVRALEKASAAALASVPSVTRIFLGHPIMFALRSNAKTYVPKKQPPPSTMTMMSMGAHLVLMTLFLLIKLTQISTPLMQMMTIQYPGTWVGASKN